MRILRLPLKDPRTVARDIPGICDLLFPQLISGLVAHLNRKAESVDECNPVPNALMKISTVNPSMLFEVAYARAESILDGNELHQWQDSIDVALRRQAKYFDAEIPDQLSEADMSIAELTANNLVNMLHHVNSGCPEKRLVIAPDVLGFHWISSGKGDFSIGSTLIEVKCTNKNFSSSDYRQILIYWLLSYASSLEKDTPEWNTAVLLNPRLNRIVTINFNELIQIVGAGRTKLEILELFSSIIGDYSLRMTDE